MPEPSFQQQLDGITDHLENHAPEPIKATIKGSIADHVSTFDKSKAIQPGDKLPAFELPNAVGETISSTELFKSGAMLITFYRGEWCPFCNIALNGLQKNIEAFRSKGVTLVAISPELPNSSMTTVEKHELKFPVLSDAQNSYAKQLGIVWTMPDSMRPILSGFGTDLEKRNGDDSFQVPVPTTLLVDKEGVVRKIHVDPNYTQRLDPAEAVKWTEEL